MADIIHPLRFLKLEQTGIGTHTNVHFSALAPLVVSWCKLNETQPRDSVGDSEDENTMN